MTKVFISYSRKDKTFAEKLNVALEEIGLDSWIDWIDIPPTADWWDQVQKGVESADAFLFLLSPDSVVSEVCGREIDHAVKNGKRLIPLVARDVNSRDVDSALRKLNWIYFREQDDFEASLKKLEAGIKTDLGWVESHRRLQVRSLEWEKRQDRSLLWRGKDLREAEEQLARAGQKDPQPTDLQRQYVLESRRRESQTRNTLLIVGGVVVVMLAFLSVFAFNQRNRADSNAFTAVANQHDAETAQSNAVNQRETAVENELEAKKQANISRAGELATLALSEKDKHFDLALLFGLESFQTFQNARSQGILLSLEDSHPGLDMYLFGHSDDNYRVAFSPDGNRLASGSYDNTIILWDVSDPAAPSPLATLSGHSDYVTSVAFSPDGNRLASGSYDDSIILWDVSDLKLTKPSQLARLSGQTSGVTRVAFSPDSNRLAAGSYDKTIILWDLDPKSWLKKGCQRAGRNFTRAEWKQYIPYKPYPTKEEDATCPQWPFEVEVTPTNP